MPDDKKADKQQEPMTVEKLQELVDDGKVTFAQAMDYVAKEYSGKAVEDALSRFRDETKAEKIKGVHEGVIARYQKAIPALLDEGSDEHKAVAKVYKRLITEGYQDGPGTERMALLEHFGKVSSVEKAKAPKPEAFKDGGSGSDDKDDDEERDDGNGAPVTFSTREKEFWGKQIQSGQVKDWKTAKQIVEKRGNPTLREAMRDKPLKTGRAA